MLKKSENTGTEEIVLVTPTVVQYVSWNINGFLFCIMFIDLC